MTMYNATVQVYKDDGRPGCACVSGCTDLSRTLADAVKDASYYHFVCAYPRVTVKVDTTCEHCGGSGWTGKRTKKRCPKCDWGTIPFIPPFDYEVHHNAVKQLTGASVA